MKNKIMKIQMETENKKETTKSNTRFCSYCGKQMLVWAKPADECFMFYGDQSTIPIASKYDKKSGKKNFVWMYRCNDYRKRKWYQIGGSPHDEYFEDNVFNFA